MAKRRKSIQIFSTCKRRNQRVGNPRQTAVIVVRGHVMGSVRGKRVMLQSSSHVEGDIYHQALAIEQGAFFEGKSRRSEDPLAGVPKPDIPPALNGAA